jgi:4-hydroxybenzoate polyprenyltransferase
MRKIADLIFLTRPPLLCASCTFFFAGTVSALRSVGQPYSIRSVVEALPNLGLFALVVASAFVVNQIYDVESDRLNRKGYVVPSGMVTRRECALVLAATGLSAVGLSLLHGSEVRYLVWLGLGLGWAYSMPPLRLKGRPLLDMLANVVGFGVIGFALGWLTYSRIDTSFWVRCAPYALAMAGIFLNTCIPDEEGDRRVGDRTSCVVWGAAKAGRAALVLIVISALAGVLSGETLCTLAVVGSLPAMLAVGIEASPANSIVASQFAARLLLVLVCIRAPLLAVLSVLVYFASRVYYRKRFRLRYPDIEGAGEVPRPSLR